MTSSPPHRALDLSPDLALALQLAELADAVSLPRFGAADLVVTEKPDMTPVSDADLAVETELRRVLAEQAPQDRIVGEEFGSDEAALRTAASGRAWVIDPIDGTKNFVRGVPIWATLIALMVDGVPQVGVVSAPAMARRWWGEIGGGSWTAFAGGPAQRCRVSKVRDLGHASVSFAQPEAWQQAGRGESMRNLSAGCWRTRGYGDFLSHVLVAQGSVDAAGEPELSLWDLAAIGPIVIPAGGRCTTTAGDDLDIAARSAVTTNGLLHDEVLRAAGI